MENKKSKPNLAVIDGDSIVYICSKENLEDSIKNVDSLIKDILKQCNAQFYYLFISEGKYFRHNVSSAYKANRPPQTLKYIRTLKNYLKEEYNEMSVSLLEADDLNAFVINNKKKEYNCINCSPDKDVKLQIAGPWYDYKKLISGNTTPEEAVKFLYKQLLSGDTADNIKGITGIGDKKSDVILDKCTTFVEMEAEVLALYKKEFGFINGLKKFGENIRLLYLLRTQEDFMVELNTEILLPEPIAVEYEQIKKKGDNNDNF